MFIFIDSFWPYGVFVAACASLVVEGGVDMVLGRLPAGPSPVAERGLWAPGFGSWGSWALEHSLNTVAHGLSCSAARGIFLDQGLTPCLLRRQANSLPGLSEKP